MKKELFIILNLSLLLVLVVFFAVLYNEGLYLTLLSSAENTTLSVQTTNELLEEFQSSQDNDLDIFNEAENSHMKDVKYLIKGNYYLMIFLIVLLLIQFYLYPYNSKGIQRIVLTTGAILIGGSIILVAIPFDFLFILFHKMFFPQGNWMFPADSVIIKLYPQEFFFNFVAVWVGVLVVLGALLIIFSIILKRTNMCKKAQ